VVPDQERLQVPVVLDFGKESRILRSEDELLVFPDQFDPSVAGDVIDDVGADICRQLVLAEAFQRPDDRWRVVACRGGVPEREGRDPVGVDVFRALLEVGESSEGVARLLLARVVHLEEHALVALDDDRVGGIVGHAMTRFTGSGVLRKSIRQPAKWR
jgi:hypothetical protein